MKRIFILITFLFTVNAYSQYAGTSSNASSFYIVLTGNYEMFKATENWSSLGGGGSLGFNWSPDVNLELYFDYLRHNNPYPSIAELLDTTIAMKSIHIGSKIAYTFASIFSLKAGLGMMKLSTEIGEEPVTSENHLESIISGGLIIPIGGLDILTECRYRRIFAKGPDVNIIGIVGGLVLYF